MTVSASRAKCHAGGGPLERPVRQQALSQKTKTQAGNSLRETDLSAWKHAPGCWTGTDS